MNGRFGLKIPYLERLVLGVTNQRVGLFIEKNAGDVVLMSWDGRVLPGDLVGILPQFDLTVIRAGRD